MGQNLKAQLDPTWTAWWSELQRIFALCGYGDDQNGADWRHHYEAGRTPAQALASDQPQQDQNKNDDMLEKWYVNACRREAELNRCARDLLNTLVMEKLNDNQQRAVTQLAEVLLGADQPQPQTKRGFHEAGPLPHPDSQEAQRRATLAVAPDDEGWHVEEDSVPVSERGLSYGNACLAMRCIRDKSL